MSEEFSRQPVAKSAANRPAKTIAMMVANATMGVPVMILGISIGAEYGSTEMWLVIGLGCAITVFLASLLAHVGVRSRRSTALLASQALGSSGAHLLNLAIAAALLGWFVVEVGFVGTMVDEGVANVFGLTIGPIPGIILASTLICAISIHGIAIVGRSPAVFLPLLSALLLLVLFLTIAAWKQPIAVSSSARPIGTGVSAIVGAYVLGSLIMPDYTRFVQTSRAAVGATAFALGPVYGLVLGTYALAGLATGGSQPATIFSGLGLPAIIGLLLPVGLMQNGIMCLYSSALTVSTFGKSVAFRSIVVILALAGTGFALIPVQSHFVTFLVFLGVVFPPAIALLIFTGLFDTCDDGQDSRSLRWSNLGVWAFGIACGFNSEWLGISLTGFSAFDGFLGAATALTVLRLAREWKIKRRQPIKFRQ